MAYYYNFLKLKQSIHSITLIFSRSITFLWQNGVTSSIKPQQITYIVPGVENFEHAEIADFIKKAQDNLVCSLPENKFYAMLTGGDLQSDLSR